jgi:hypothetical protein
MDEGDIVVAVDQHPAIDLGRLEFAGIVEQFAFRRGERIDLRKARAFAAATTSGRCLYPTPEIRPQETTGAQSHPSLRHLPPNTFVQIDVWVKMFNHKLTVSKRENRPLNGVSLEYRIFYKADATICRG